VESALKVTNPLLIISSILTLFSFCFVLFDIL
jgi:hypothetical protein